MSTYRPLSRSRHIDERLMSVGPISRAVWDYLCCNQQDHASGLYRLSIATACEDTGWSPEQFEDAMRELEVVGLIERDLERRLVWVRNMLRWNYPRPSEKQRISIERHIRSMPRTPLIARMAEYYSARLGIALCAEQGVSNGIPDTHSHGYSDPSGRVLSDSVSVSVSDSGSGSDRARAKPTPTAPPSPTPPTRDTSWTEVARVVDRLPWISAKGVKLLSPRDRIHKLVVAGATADEIVRVLEGLAAAVDAGKEPTAHWNAQYVFSGHYDGLRTRYGGGAAAVGPPEESTVAKLARLEAARGGAT